MGQLTRSNNLGSSIGTTELESPERAQDHFSTGQTSPARALDTVYQNTGTTARLVMMTVTANAAGTHRYTPKVGAANPPTVAVAGEMTNVNAARYHWTFIVPPGFYYEADLTTANTNAATLNLWEEMAL